MGASRRRIDRRLSRAASLPPLAPPERPWLLPVVSLTGASALALVLLSVDQLSAYMPGNWFVYLGIAAVVVALLAVVAAADHAWRRQREGLRGRALLWAVAALGSALVGIVAVLIAVESAQIASVISGADVRRTKPVIESLPQPPGTKLIDQRPGLADTESISEDFSASDLSTVVPFYERELAKRGWVEDKTSATTRIVRFTKDDFVLSVGIDPPSSGFTLVVDRLPASPSASATGLTPSAAPSP